MKERMKMAREDGTNVYAKMLSLLVQWRGPENLKGKFQRMRKTKWKTCGEKEE